MKDYSPDNTLEVNLRKAWKRLEDLGIHMRGI